MRRSSATLAASAALAALLSTLTAVASAAASVSGSVSAAGARTTPGPAAGLAPGASAAARAMTLVRRHVRAAARRPGEVTGLVRSFTGLPLAGACVTAAGPSGVRTARTGSGGRYTLAGLRTGAYTLEFRDCAQPGRYLARWSGGALTPGLARPVLVTGGRSTPAATVTLPPAAPAVQYPSPTAAQLAGPSAARIHLGGISGRVTSARGRPTSRTCVEVWFSENGYLTVKLSRRGTYSTGRELPPGRYRVEFAAVDCGANPGNWAPQWYKNKTRMAAATYVRVTRGRITRGIDARLRHGGIISGLVTTRTGARLSGSCVILLSAGGQFLTEAPYRHGQYQFRGLLAGRYRVLFLPGCGYGSRYLPQYWPDASSPGQARAIAVRLRHTVTGINARLQVGGTVTGTVRYKTTTGRPLSGICVDLNTGGFLNGADYSGQTGPSGQYRIEGVPTGRYSAQFSPGCNNNGNYLDGSYPHPVQVTDGQTRRGIDGVLQPGAIISGRVTGPSGRPLRGIFVLVQDPAGDFGGSCTGPRGGYLITQLPPGGYTAEFSSGCGTKGNWAPQFYRGQTDAGHATVIRLGLGQRASGIDATMRPGSVITGRVTSRAGRPIPKICAIAQDPADAYGNVETGGAYEGNEAETRSDGRYRIQNLGQGRYAVQFVECGRPRYADRWYGGRPGAPIGDIVDVGPASTVAGISTVLGPGGAIGGHTRAGRRGRKPGLGVCEILTNLRTGAFTSSQLFFVSSYEITGLPPGRYSVEFYACLEGTNFADQWYRDKFSPAGPTPVVVTAGHTTGPVSATMTPGGKITGRLTSQATGRPLARFCVEAFSGSAFFNFASTGRDGRYTINALNTGRYSLLTVNCDGTSAPAASVPLPGTVRVTAPRTTHAPDEAVPDGGSISGVVQAGSPATGQGNVCVEAVPLSATGEGGFASTDGSGRYAMTNLAAGRYQVYFDTVTDCDYSPNGLVPQWYHDAASQAAAQIVTVRAGQRRTGIDARLRADGGITGTVTAAASGARLTGICVQAVPRGARPAVSVTASARGGYSLTGLAPGRYTVRFAAGCGAAGYATQWWRGARSAAAATVITVRADAVVTGISARMRR